MGVVCVALETLGIDSVRSSGSEIQRLLVDRGWVDFGWVVYLWSGQCLTEM